MSAAVWMERMAVPSPRFKARTAGFFWLMTFVTGAMAMAILSKLIVSGDAAATTANIIANEASLRMGVVANLIATACYVAATVFVYDLLKPVGRNVSLLAALFSLLGCAMGAVSSFLHLAPLVLMGSTQTMNGFTLDQLQSLGYVFVRLRAQSENISFLFFGLHCLLVGILIFRSKFLPRFIGALMVFAGLGWLTQSFSYLLSPPLARSLAGFVMIPGVLGEGSLTLWLLVIGVNVQRWNERERS